jgi:hypothetical protein
MPAGVIFFRSTFHIDAAILKVGRASLDQLSHQLSAQDVFASFKWRLPLRAFRSFLPLLALSFISLCFSIAFSFLLHHFAFAPVSWLQPDLPADFLLAAFACFFSSSSSSRCLKRPN